MPLGAGFEGPSAGRGVSQFEPVPLLTDQSCARPDEEGADSLTRTSEAWQMAVGSNVRLSSSSMADEEILMSRLCEGA